MFSEETIKVTFTSDKGLAPSFFIVRSRFWSGSGRSDASCSASSVQLYGGLGSGLGRVRRQVFLGGGGGEVRQEQESPRREEEGQGGAGEPDRNVPHRAVSPETGIS